MIRHAYWIATLIIVVLVGAKFDRSTGFTSLIRFGETWAGRRHSSLQNRPVFTVANSSGYDGQFYAQIALSPLLNDAELDHVIDAPAYRARRILVPALAAITGCGSPWWVLQAYALINPGCWIALGWLLRREIGSGTWMDFARWTGCMFSVGVVESVRQSLVDLPALLLLVLAIRALAVQRTTRGTCWLALGNLAKETTLIGTLALNATPDIFDRLRWRRTLVRIIVAALPLGLWWLYVDHRFSPPAVADGLGNFTWPLLGLFGHARLCLHEIAHGNLDGRYSFGLLAIVGLIIQSVTLWRAPNFTSSWWRVGAAYSLLLPFLSIWVWSGYWAACRAALPLTISFNLILPANRAFWPLWILGNLTLLHAVWRFL